MNKLKNRQIKNKQLSTISDEEWNRIQSVTDKDPMYRAIFALLYENGASPNEIIGLRWKDINFESKKVCLSISIGVTRNIPLGKMPLERLNTWQTLCQLAKPELSAFDFVFMSGNGSPLTYRRYRKEFQSYLKAAKVPPTKRNRNTFRRTFMCKIVESFSLW